MSNLKIGNIPRCLRDRPRWTVWRSVPGRNGKPSKPPVDAKSGGPGNVRDPTTWSSFPVALEAVASGQYQGVQFILSDQDDLVGVDVDKCRDVKTGKIDPLMFAAVKALDSYTELSPSGCGLRVFLSGSLPGNGRNKNGVEVYADRKALTVTGNRLRGFPRTVNRRQKALAAFLHQFFGETDGDTSQATEEIVVELRPDAAPDLDGLCKKAKRLAEGDYTGYASPSQAEQALANYAVAAGWSDQETCNLLVAARVASGEQPKALSYYKLTIAKAHSSRLNTVKVKKKKVKKTVPEPTPTEGKEGFKLTDLGNAERFADAHRDTIHYCHDLGIWLVWNGKRWQPDQAERVVQLAGQVARGIYSEASKAADDERPAIAKHAIGTERRERLTAMLALARAQPGVSAKVEDLDADPWLLGCLDGTIDLRTGKLRPPDPADLITRSVRPEFNPKAKCPLWEKFLSRIFDKNTRLIQWLQRYVGYCLTGHTWEQILVVFWGGGSNGKSTFVNTILSMLTTDYGIQAEKDLLLLHREDTHPTGLTDLAGRRLVATLETDKGRRLAESVVKQLTGGDRIRARAMRANYFEFIPTHKLILATNHKPKIIGTDHAIWRRVRLVPFTVKIPDEEQDKELTDKLKGELPGILQWAIKGCLSWQRYGLKPPKEITVATKQYRDASDLIGDFLKAKCHEGEGLTVKAGDLYAKYRIFCTMTEEKPATQREFGESLTDRGVERGRSNGVIYKGLGLKKTKK